MEKNAEKPKKEIFVRAIKKPKDERPYLVRAFPKNGNIVANGYVLSLRTIQPNGRMLFVPIAKVVSNPKENKNDSGN